MRVPLWVICCAQSTKERQREIKEERERKKEGEWGFNQLLSYVRTDTKTDSLSLSLSHTQSLKCCFRQALSTSPTLSLSLSCTVAECMANGREGAIVNRVVEEAEDENRKLLQFCDRDLQSWIRRRRSWIGSSGFGLHLYFGLETNGYVCIVA
jgi:hypothetical protein